MRGNNSVLLTFDLVVSVMTSVSIVTDRFRDPMQVLHYLGRYTHRVAISKNRLLAFEQERVFSAGRTMPTVASKAR
jgi:hypothetical protein